MNHPSMIEYPVRGVDVSHYQGAVDWPVLAAQGIAFAFLKATEGSRYQDDRFIENLRGALSTPLRVGAYHFFSFDSPGETQAENFLGFVPRIPGMLPPVVDVEFYGDKAKHPPAQDGVRRELAALLTRLTRQYGVRPVLYASEASYAAYLAGAFLENGIWIRNVTGVPRLPDGRAWTFWQYADSARLPGYSGPEPCIDMNAFCGSAAEFARYGAPDAAL